MLKIFKYIFIYLLLFISINLNASDKFDYGLLDSLLNKYVDGEKVNYKGLVNEKENLFRFTEQLAKISPDSHQELFITRNEKLAYWINAYNAYILQTIVEDYPVESIKDINFIGVYFAVPLCWIVAVNLSRVKIEKG